LPIVPKSKIKNQYKFIKNTQKEQDPNVGNSHLWSSKQHADGYI